jgi:hypothetical protein
MGYAGQDFPPTTQDAVRSYTLDFVNGIQIFFTEVVTIGGTVTAGDTLILTIQNNTLPGLQQTISYQAIAADTPVSIAAQLASLINGTDTLDDAMIKATVSGAIITVSSPGQSPTLITGFVVPPGTSAVTETILVTAGLPIGELISSATCTTEVFTGYPDGTSRILSAAQITGSKVTVLAGGFLPGNNYRLNFVAITNEGQNVPLYSHVACVTKA